jgi:hypothetical protein
MTLGGCFAAHLGVLQNDAAPLLIGKPPFLDFLDGSKATETVEVIIQAAISSARRLNGAFDRVHIVDVTH